MTEPTRYDEVTIDPEYRRSYDHYLSTMHPQDEAAQAAAAELAYAWTKLQQSLRALRPAPKTTNHVAHGLLLAFTVFIGGPVAFLIGVGATIGNEAEGVEPHPEAFWSMMALWAVVVVLQGLVWALSARQR
jgi:hypothetical protein